MNEYPRAAEWLYATLTTPPITGVVTRVYEHPAPEDVVQADNSYVTFQLQAPVPDLTVIGEHRIWSEMLFLVRATKRSRSTATLKAIADAIDARLHRTSGTVSDGRVVASDRVSPYHDTEITDGVTYKHLGGVFSLLVQPLNP